MSTFTINQDNNITVYASAEEAAQSGDATAIVFDSKAALAKVSFDWPLSRFVEIWNSIPGNSEVSKFQDRKKAVERVWKAIQPLASEASKPEPEKLKRKQAKPAKKAGEAKSAKSAAERTYKKAEVIAMMKRAKGTTLTEIVEATGWQKHTVRGFVSVLGSKGGEKVESSKNATGERVYKIAK